MESLHLSEKYKFDPQMVQLYRLPLHLLAHGIKVWYYITFKI